MPTSEEHIRQAQHNIDFLETFFESHTFNDWSITVSFYSAVHIIENAIFNSANLTYSGKPIKISHSTDLLSALQKINTQIAQNSPHIYRSLIVQENFSDISDFYSLLYKESRNARYKGYQFKNNDTNLIVKPAIREIVNWSNDKFKTGLKLAIK